MTRAELTERLARALCRHCGGPIEEWEDCLDDIEPILSELDALGLAIVPSEASKESVRVGVDLAHRVSLSADYHWPEYMADLWRAMLAAGEVK